MCDNAQDTPCLLERKDPVIADLLRHSTEVMFPIIVAIKHWKRKCTIWTIGLILWAHIHAHTHTLFMFKRIKTLIDSPLFTSTGITCMWTIWCFQYVSYYSGVLNSSTGWNTLFNTKARNVTNNWIN